MSYLKTKLRGEILKEEMGYFTKDEKIIPSVEAKARQMVGDEIVPLEQKIHIKPFYKR